MLIGRASAIPRPGSNSAPGSRFSHDLDGWLAGGQAGFNWQTGPWVLGAEVSVSGGDLAGSSQSVVSATDDRLKTEVGTLVTVVGRLGYAWDRWLAYAKAGYAGANVKFSASDIGGGGPSGSTSDSDFENGYTLGAGLEYMLTSNLSLGVDYSFVSLTDARRSFGDGAGQNITLNRDDLDVHAVTARINYRFN